MNGMDPYMVREFAQDMSQALAVAEAEISRLTSMIEAIHKIHYEVDGKCMGCSKSLSLVDGMQYEPYPCINIKAMKEANW